jgi:hypothetical protein
MFFFSYSSGALLAFCFWFNAFYKDKTTPKTDGISWIILIVGGVLWPIVLPISFYQSHLCQTQLCQTQLADG